jgi:hypothetical protein
MANAFVWQALKELYRPACPAKAHYWLCAEFVYLAPNAIACALPQTAPVSDYSMAYEGETTVIMFKRALAANGPVPGRRQTGQYIVNLAEVWQCCLPGPERLLTGLACTIFL